MNFSLKRRARKVEAPKEQWPKWHFQGGLVFSKIDHHDILKVANVPFYGIESQLRRKSM